MASRSVRSNVWAVAGGRLRSRRARDRRNRRCRSTGSGCRPGSSIEVVARVPNARAMTWGADGHAVRRHARTGTVYAVTLARRARPPRGHGSSRGVCASRRASRSATARSTSRRSSRILRYDDIEQRLDDPPAPVVVSDRFPTDGHHGRKFIAFGPDGKLYVPVGAPCNICEPDPERYANITPDEPRRQRPRGLRPRRAQHGRLRLAPADEGAVVHRQRPRQDGRRHAARRAQPRDARRASTSAIRTATAARSPTRSSARQRACSEFVAARAEPRAARRGARDALLHRHAVSRGVPQPGLHRRARLVEPQPRRSATA